MLNNYLKVLFIFINDKTYRYDYVYVVHAYHGVSFKSITENLEDILFNYNVLESSKTGEYTNVNKRDNDHNTPVPELHHQ